MFAFANDLSETEMRVNHAAQDLIREGTEPTTSRIADRLPTFHQPTIQSTRGRLIRRGVLAIPAKLAVKLHIHVEPIDVKIVAIDKTSALDRIISIGPRASRKAACRAMVRAFHSMS